jgi:hypothetical protein
MNTDLIYIFIVDLFHTQRYVRQREPLPYKSGTHPSGQHSRENRAPRTRATDTNFEAEQALFARPKHPSMEARLLRPMAAAAILAALVVLAAPAAAQGADGSDAPAYRNHTVGGKDGWFFDAKTNTSSGNYSDWANGETFYLGDYLSKLIDTFFSLSPHCCSASSWFSCFGLHSALLFCE